MHLSVPLRPPTSAEVGRTAILGAWDSPRSAAPGVGRAMAELLLDGGYETLDLSRFGYRRVIDDEPLFEAGIV